MVFLGAFPVYRTLTAIAALGILLTAAYLLWMVQRVFLGPYVALHKDESGHYHPAGEIDPIRWNEWVVLIPLAVLCLWIGLVPQPLINIFKVSSNVITESLR